MKKLVLTFFLILGSTNLSNAACTQTGYVGTLQYWMKNGYAYLLDASLYDYIGGTYTGTLRIVSFPRGTQTPTNNLEDKKDTKEARASFHKAFDEYLRLSMTTTESQGGACVANTAQEFYVSFIR